MYVVQGRLQQFSGTNTVIWNLHQSCLSRRDCHTIKLHQIDIVVINLSKTFQCHWYNDSGRWGLIFGGAPTTDGYLSVMSTPPLSQSNVYHCCFVHRDTSILTVKPGENTAFVLPVNTEFFYFLSLQILPPWKLWNTKPTTAQMECANMWGNYTSYEQK